MALFASTTAGLAQIEYNTGALYVEGAICSGHQCGSHGYPGAGIIEIAHFTAGMQFRPTGYSGQAHDPNDWAIRIDNPSGAGADAFIIEDMDSATQPMAIEAGAVTNTLRIGQNGQVGIGTMIPATTLHIANGGLPTLRLERDGSYGQTDLNTWDFVNSIYGLFINDVTAGTSPLALLEGAPTGSLVVKGDGNVGIGASDPLRPLHVADPAAAVIRMEHTVPSGTPYSWDLTANQHQFFILDANTNQAPFIVAAEAPHSMLYLAKNGNVGIGDSGSPLAALHVKRSDNTAALLIEETAAGTLGQLHLKNNGITYFTLEDTSRPVGDNTGRAWNFQNQGGTFRVTTAPGGPGEIEMQMTPQGDMYIKGQLYTGTGGATTECVLGCDRVFDADYDLPSIAQHQADMKALKHLPAVGPTPENGPFNLSQMTGGMLNELEKAHLYIAELDARDAARQAHVDRLESELADMRRLLGSVTARLGAD